MNFDFSLLLVIATLVTGAIWAIDSLLFAPKRRAAGEVDEETGEVKEPWLVEFAHFLFPVVLVVLVLRGFIAEPFRIPSGSMLPTLEVGDFILVSKFSYGIRLPVTQTKIIDLGGPERGDVIVFKYPENPKIDYIKRVVGVPGDKVAYYNKKLFINDQPAELVLKGIYKPGFPNSKRYHEDLLGVEHDILLNSMYPAGDFVINVPENKYFVMGDNRDNSRDSRYWGFVPDENLVGKAFMIWMNWDLGNAPQLSRIGTVIE